MSIAPQKDDRNSGLNEKERLLKAIKDEEGRGMEITKSYVDTWQENLRYFFSDQLAGKRQHKDWDWVVLNYIWSAAQQETAKIMRNRPSFVADPWEESDADVAEAWQGWIQWMWDRGLNDVGMDIEQCKAVLCGKIYGYRVFKVFWEARRDWDAERRIWVGDVRGRLWKPNLFWSTGEESIQEGNCGTVRYVELDYAVKLWPDYAKKLTEEATRMADELADMTGGDSIMGQTGASSTYPSAGVGKPDKGERRGGGLAGSFLDRILEVVGVSRRRDDKDPARYVKLSEGWFKDWTEAKKSYSEPVPVEELKAQNKIYQQPGDPSYYELTTGRLLTAEDWPQRDTVTWQEPKFPRGRHILRAGDTILNEDEDEQRYPFRLWPFITSPHYLVPFMWQGTDSVQMVKSTQDMLNVSCSYLVNHIKQFGNPRIAVERGAIDSPKARDKSHFTLGSGAGAILRLAKGGLTRFKIIDPTPASPTVFGLYQLMAQEFKNMTGLQDIAQGKKASGEMSATESSYLALSASDRIELQMLLERNWIKRIAVLACEICQHHYEPQRLVRILGENAVPGIMQITQRHKDVRFDINIEVGSSLPFDKEKRIAKYMQANQLLMGPPSPMLPQLLQQLEIAGWRKILKAHATWQEWMGFKAILEKVESGEMDPKEAFAVLMQQTQETLMKAAGKQDQQAQQQPQQAAGPQGGTQ